MAPVEIDGNPITGATIDGTDVQEITVDGDVVFTALNIPDSVVTRQQDDATSPESSPFGMVVKPLEDWDDIGARLSNNTSGVTKAYIYDFSDGTLIADVDISSLSGGDAFTFGASIEANEQYSFVADAEGSSYTNGRFDGTTDLYPIDSPDGNLSFTGSIEAGGGLTGFGNNTHANVFREVGNVGF